MDENTAKQGLQLLCLMTCSPLLIGAFLGWKLRDRYHAYGPLGMWLPGFIRRMLV